MKKGAVLKIEMTPTKYGWRVNFTRRSGHGGIDFSQNTTKTLDDATQLIGSTVSRHGYEPEDS